MPLVYSSTNREENLLELAQEAFERWHKRLLDAAQPDTGPWHLILYADWRSALGPIDEVVVRQDDAHIARIIESEQKGAPYTEWSIQRYRSSNREADGVILCGKTRSGLLPHHEGDFSADLAILAAAGVRFEIFYRPNPDPQREIRRGLAHLGDRFVLRDASFSELPQFVEEREYANFIQRTDSSPEIDRVRFAELTEEYLCEVETDAQQNIKKARYHLETIEAALINKFVYRRDAASVDEDSVVETSESGSSELELDDEPSNVSEAALLDQPLDGDEESVKTQ